MNTDALRDESDRDPLSLRKISNAIDLLDALFDRSLDPMFMLDLEGTVERWNPAANRLFGWSASEVVGEVLPHVPKDLRIKMICDIRVAAGGSAPMRIASPARRRDGSTFRVEIVMLPLSDAERLSTGVLCICGTDAAFAAGGSSEDAFASIITQELRSPLTAILGYAQLLGRQEILDDPVKRSRTLRSLRDRGHRMAQLVDDLILAAAIDRQGLDLEMERVDLVSLVTDVVGRHETRSRVHRFILEMDPGIPPIEVDRGRITDALDRLLINATTYAPEGGDIIVSVRTTGAGVDIVVSDSGIGLSSAELTRVFERFYQADMTSDRRFEGVGLGLYIVSAIAHAHGGVVVARSREEGGSKFTLHLPLERTPMPDAG